MLYYNHQTHARVFFILICRLRDLGLNVTAHVFHDYNTAFILISAVLKLRLIQNTIEVVVPRKN